MKVVLDTNAFLMPVANGIDVRAALAELVGQADLVVAITTIDELRRLQDGAGATARAAKAGGRLLVDCTVEATKLPGDDGVLDVARRLGAAVLSNDKAVLEEARKSGLTAIAPRGHALWFPYGTG